MFLRLSIFFTCILVQKNAGSPLHGACLSTEDCGTIDTYCRNQTCVCRENFSVWYDSCIELPSPAIRCSKKQECHELLGPRSMCTKKNQCACKPFHHLHQGQCVKNRDLHDQCEHDHQCYCGAECQAKIACIHKSCTCKPGHKPYKIRRCMEDPAYIDIPDVFNLTTATVHKHKSIDQAEQNQVLPRISTSLSIILRPEYSLASYLLLIIIYV
ncbi:uncharacterized protein LOC130897805 [Diorhabda carinulata]|uniref:uncharacterized protein LOC130897805 n=1 Tax=Diorhabda carinulata TaxID=1163345 RepID=UPI00259FE3B9|nr:uncharacterized protein LOC130897805 [Diorhabda carinulata]XP_057662701.1 uncharacterized protein LOC130897805 [Diorhabda carinulata]